MSGQPNRGRQGLGRGRIIRNRNDHDDFTSSSEDESENGAFYLPDHINPEPEPEPEMQNRVAEIEELMNYELNFSSGDEKEEKEEKFEQVTANRKMQERGVRVPTAFEEQRDADIRRRSRPSRLRDYDEYTQEDYVDAFPIEKPKIVDSDEEARAFSSIPFVDNSFLSTRRTQLPLEAVRAAAPQPPVQVPAPRRQSQNRERKPRGKRPGPPGGPRK